MNLIETMIKIIIKIELSSFIRFIYLAEETSSNFYNNLVNRTKNYYRMGKGVSRTQEVLPGSCGD